MQWRANSQRFGRSWWYGCMLGAAVVVGLGGCDDKKPVAPVVEEGQRTAVPAIATTGVGDVIKTEVRFAPVKPGEFAQVIAHLDGPQTGSKTYTVTHTAKDDPNDCINNFPYKVVVHGVGYSRILVWLETRKGATGNVRCEIARDGQAPMLESEFAVSPENAPDAPVGTRVDCKPRGELGPDQVGMPSFAMLYVVEAGDMAAIWIGLDPLDPLHGKDRRYLVTIVEDKDSAVRSYSKELTMSPENTTQQVMIWMDTNPALKNETTVTFKVERVGVGHCTFTFIVRPKGSGGEKPAEKPQP